MAILVSKAAASTTTDANTNVYNLGSKDSENVIFGVDSSSETFQLSGTNKVTILDVSNGDKVVHSGLSSSGVQAKVTGNTVTLSDGTNDKLVLGALAGGESVTVEFSDGKVVTIAASSATTPVYTVVQSGKSTTLNGTAASVTDSTAPAAVDLASTDGIQATTSITVNAAEASAGKSIASAIQAPTALDIASIKIVLSGAGLDVTGSSATDQLILDSAKYLDADFTSGSSAVTINQITGLDYAYTASNKTLLITKNGGGALTATDVDNIVAGVKFKTAQADGNRIATLSYVDIAGNEGTSAAVTIAVDKTAPIAPTTLNLATADDSGINTTDDITSITTGLSIDGVAVTGESIQLYDGGTPISGAVATASNNAFTIDVALTEGSHTITAKATDLAGNTGDASSSLHIVVDTTAPSAPTSVAVTTLGGTVTSNTITETNTNLTASATITANQGATVAYLKVGSTIIASDTSIASTDTSVTFDLDQTTIEGLQSKIPLGGGVVSVELRDAAGNSVTSSANNPTLAEAPVRLIKNDGTIKLYATLDANSTLSTSLSIERALTEADNGSVIELAPGTYYAGTGTQSGIAALVSDYGQSGNPYVINKAVTIRGLDDPSTSSTIDTTFSLLYSTGFEILGKIPGMVTFENIKFLDGAYGVYVRGDAASGTKEYNSGATVVLGGLTIRNSEFDNQGSSGLGVMLNNEPSSLGNLIIENVKFDQHANSTNSSGQSIFHEGIMSFGFDGTASLSNVQVIGTTGTSTPLTSPYYGIQIQGALGEQLSHTGQSAYTDPNSRWYQMGPTLGTVTLNNVDFSGNFQRGALGVSKYANIDGLAGPNPLGQPIDAVDFTNATVTNATPGYAQFFTEGLASSYDASKFGFVGGVRVLQGDLSSQTVTNNIIKGTDGADGINGLAGNDKLYGGAGTDTIIGGAGSDTISGGDGADTFVITADDTSTDVISDWGNGADVFYGAYTGTTAGLRLKITIADVSVTPLDLQRL